MYIFVGEYSNCRLVNRNNGETIYEVFESARLVDGYKRDREYDYPLLKIKDFACFQWGVVNMEDGIIITPCQWEDIEIIPYWHPHGHNVYWVKNNGKWGLIDHEGDTLYPCELDEILGFNFVWLDALLVKTNGKFSCFDLKKLSVCADCEWNEIVDLSFVEDETILVKKDNKLGCFDLRSKYMCVDCLYDEIVSIEDGLAFKVKQNGKWGCYGSWEILSCEWDDIVYLDFGSSRDRFYGVMWGGLWGLFDEYGLERYPCTAQSLAELEDICKVFPEFS